MPVTHGPVIGSGLNAFPLYRDDQEHQAEDAIEAAMGSSNTSLKLMQDRVMLTGVTLTGSANFGFERGIFNALENGSTVQYIFNSQAYGILSAFPYFMYKERLLQPYDSTYGTNLESRFKAKTKPGLSYIHTKAIGIDGQMLIVGSSNFDFSSWGENFWGENFGQSLAEYNMGIDYKDPLLEADKTATANSAIGRYEWFFDQEWESSDYELVETLLLPISETIQEYLEVIYRIKSPGLPILFLPEGVYNETITIDEPVTIIGLNAAKTIIEPPEGQPALRVLTSGVTIYNLTVRGSTGYGVELIDSSPNSLEDIQLRRILFEDNALGGVLVKGLISGSPVKYSMENNTFIGGQYGVTLNLLEEQAQTSHLENNLFWGQSQAAVNILSNNDGGAVYQYNLFNNCSRAEQGVCPTNWYSGTLSINSTVDHNLLNLDPGFINSAGGDYTLLPSSPLIDAGDPSTINEPGVDGVIPRRADIGAFESELNMEFPDPPFQAKTGRVVIEAENYTYKIRGGRRDWVLQTAINGYTGTGYITALPDTDLNVTNNPQVQYRFNLTSTGVYTLWLRGYAPNASGDSVYVQLDQQDPLTMTGFIPGQWTWTDQQMSTLTNTVTFEVSQPGIHTLSLWIREDGLRLDRLVLSTNPTDQPVNFGPAESELGTYLDYLNFGDE